MKRSLIWVGIVLVLLGCESTRELGEGDVYVVNNLGSRINFPYHSMGTSMEEIYIVVEWEGERINIQPNMDEDGNCTGVGAFRITSEPLAGGVLVDFLFLYLYVGSELDRMLSDVLEEKVVVDGDITIELYTEKWEPANDRMYVLAKVHKGKYDGIHLY
jgi:hypothetical protein